MKIEVCLGSSCHVKGGQQILRLLKENIKKNDIENKVELAGTVCLGECKSGGVNMKVDGEIVTGITEKNFDQFFKNKVLSPMGK